MTGEDRYLKFKGLSSFFLLQSAFLKYKMKIRSKVAVNEVNSSEINIFQREGSAYADNRPVDPKF